MVQLAHDGHLLAGHLHLAAGHLHLLEDVADSLPVGGERLALHDVASSERAFAEQVPALVVVHAHFAGTCVCVCVQVARL